MTGGKMLLHKVLQNLNSHVRVIDLEENQKVVYMDEIVFLITHFRKGKKQGCILI